MRTISDATGARPGVGPAPAVTPPPTDARPAVMAPTTFAVRSWRADGGPIAAPVPLNDLKHPGKDA
jgi:hypothetical protein